MTATSAQSHDAQNPHVVPYIVEFGGGKWLAWQVTIPVLLLLAIGVIEQIFAAKGSDSWRDSINFGEIARCGGFMAAILTLNCCREQLSLIGSALEESDGPEQIITRSKDQLVFLMVVSVVGCIITLLVSLESFHYPTKSLNRVLLYVSVNIGVLLAAALYSLFLIYRAFDKIAEAECAFVASGAGVDPPAPQPAPQPQNQSQTPLQSPQQTQPTFQTPPALPPVPHAPQSQPPTRTDVQPPGPPPSAIKKSYPQGKQKKKGGR